MKRSLWRKIAAVLILVATIAAFTVYFIKHPEVRHQLGQTSPNILVLLLALYLTGIVALAFVTIATVRLYKLRLEPSESLLLTMYTAIINFFGPLQSGPAFRAVYLKKKYKLSLKHYTIATLIYYCFYGGFSVLLLLSTTLKWWLLPLALAGFAVLFGASRSKRLQPRLQGIDLRGWTYLALATLAQIVIVLLIYYTELRTVAPGTSFSQAMVYTGAANLALFVSLTPGAIGFRESFLVFSQHLHHISNSTIVAANILDRAMYLVLLLILALIIFGTHARRQLGVDKDTTS
jgi:uncharacterized membrane protein YbhN (UPF0104 family)